jgi:hypothetical protein
MARASNGFVGLVLGGILLVGGLLVEPSRAQEGRRVEADYPSGSETAFEWRYSCAEGRSCSFSCSGSGGASSVTKLSMRLMTIPLGEKNVAGIFYEYSTVEIAHVNGFNITTGLSKLSCQVNGMDLDYSGLPKNKSSSDAVSSLSR